MDSQQPPQPTECSPRSSKRPRNDIPPATPTDEAKQPPSPLNRAKALYELPAEVLLCIAGNLSAPQHLSLAIANKQMMRKMGSPGPSALRGLSHPRFLPVGFVRVSFPDARTLARDGPGSVLRGEGRTKYLGLKDAPDEGKVYRLVRSDASDGNVIVQTRLVFSASKDSADMDSIARALRHDRPQACEERETTHRPEEVPLDYCCPHVRWTRDFPDEVFNVHSYYATFSLHLPFDASGLVSPWAVAPVRDFASVQDVAWRLRRQQPDPVTDSRFALDEGIHFCESCCTAYRCRQRAFWPGLSEVYLESWRNLGPCRTMSDPMWLSQVTDDFPVKSTISAEAWSQNYEFESF